MVGFGCFGVLRMISKSVLFCGSGVHTMSEYKKSRNVEELLEGGNLYWRFFLELRFILSSIFI